MVMPMNVPPKSVAAMMAGHIAVDRAGSAADTLRE
jgi:hypothetical protein